MLSNPSKRARKEVDEPAAQDNVCRTECICGLHLLYPPTRIKALGDATRQSKFNVAIESALRSASCPLGKVLALDVSDGSVLGLCAAALGCGRVVSLEEKILSEVVWSQVRAR
jgi:hypothetical protein